MVTQELYKRYRPTSLDEVLGQEQAVKLLKAKIKAGTVPHALLFSGSSGIGKTTLARIVASEIGCSTDKIADFSEINCANAEAMDMTRLIQKAVHTMPMFSKCRVWLLDEFQSLSRAGHAQQAMLKILEELPSTAYIFIATTDPSKIIPTVRNRCTEINLKPLKDVQIGELLTGILLKEDLPLNKPILRKIVELAEGSARKALVLLEQVILCASQQDALELLEKPDTEAQAFDLCKKIMNRFTKWPEVAELLKQLEGEEPEKLRRMVLGYARKMLLSGGKQARMAAAVIDVFQYNVFDSGAPGLALMSWNVMQNRQ